MLPQETKMKHFSDGLAVQKSGDHSNIQISSIVWFCHTINIPTLQLREGEKRKQVQSEQF